MVPLFVKLKAQKASFASKLARVDWVGGILFIGGMTSFLIGISWAGIQYRWARYVICELPWVCTVANSRHSAQTLVPILVGVTVVVGAIAWEIFYAKEPFLRPALFSSPSAMAGFGCAFGQGFLVSPRPFSIL